MVNAFWRKRALENSKIWIEASCVSHTGLVRENNEDNCFFRHRYLPLEHEDMEFPVTGCFRTALPKAVAVFDGMGGENAGEMASYTAAKAFAEEESPNKIQPGYLRHLMEKLNHAVCKEAHLQRLGQIGTTATILMFYKDNIFLANMGDSPAYLFRDNKLMLISKLHTDEDFLRQQNIKKRKPSVTQFLGIPEEEYVIEPYVAEGKIQKGDIYLICSDGLSDMVGQEVICNILKRDIPVKETVAALLEEALQQGGKDNTTIIVCKVGEK